MSLKSVEKKGKRIFGAALRAVLPSRSVNPTEQDWNRIERVLLVRQDRRIGDLVMNTPLFHATRRRFPKAHIALLLRREYEALYEADPHLDELIPFSSGRDFCNPVGFAALASRLRRDRFDLAIDCSNFMSFSLTNGVITLLSGAPIRIGFDDKESPAFLNVTVKQGVPRHYVENQLELLGPLGGADTEEGPWLNISAERRDRARRVLRDLGIEEHAPKALVFTGAGNMSKTWGRERFLEVARRLSVAGVRVVLAQAPRAGVEHAPGSGPRSVGSDAAAGAPLRLPDMAIADFAAAISCFDVFVSGDTGPMHVAAACGVPTVSVFLEDNVERYGYREGPRHRALRVTQSSGSEDVAAAALDALGAGRS